MLSKVGLSSHSKYRGVNGNQLSETVERRCVTTLSQGATNPFHDQPDPLPLDQQINAAAQPLQYYDEDPYHSGLSRQKLDELERMALEALDEL